MKHRVAILVALAFSIVPLVAEATITSLGENFQAVAGGSYTGPVSLTGSVFDVVSGTVDALATPLSGGAICTTAGGSPTCIDLAGSPGGGATLRSADTFAAGVYDLRFDLAGANQEDGIENTTQIFFGNLVGVPITLPNNASFTTHTFHNVVVTPPTGEFLVFFQEGSDSSGNLLDNVVVTPSAVPEPAAFALVVAGAAGLALSHRRRRR